MMEKIIKAYMVIFGIIGESGDNLAVFKSKSDAEAMKESLCMRVKEIKQIFVPESYPFNKIDYFL